MPACTARRAGGSGRSGAEPTGPATSSRAGRAATMRSPALIVPPSSSASGPPMQKLSSRRKTFLSFQPPAIGEEEIEAVTETLRSGWLTTGPRSEELERRFAEYVGSKHGVALASGTAAMHVRLVAAGISPGDEVITSPITWPATGNVIVHSGATPVFVDVRDDDLNIDPEAAAAAVTERTSAIMPVDLAGQPADLDPLLALGLPVIEDAAHATESFYRGRKVGAIALATCFSLYATKNVAAAE